jgi:hypothetical protein
MYGILEWLVLCSIQVPSQTFRISCPRSLSVSGETVHLSIEDQHSAIVSRGPAKPMNQT